MAGKSYPIPDGFPTITPYIKLQDAARAIQWYKQVFGATVMLHIPEPNGKILHAEIRIGSSMVMLTDDPEPPAAPGQRSSFGPPLALFIYVEDVDALQDRATAAGAKVLTEMKDYPDEGDRRGGFEDPFGVSWYIASHYLDVSREQMQKNFDAKLKQQGGAGQ